MTSKSDRLIHLLETQQLDEISIPMPAGIQNLINKAVDARARYNRDAAAKVYSTTEKAKFLNQVQAYYRAIVAAMEQHIGPNRSGLTFQTVTYKFLYDQLRYHIEYGDVKLDDRILLRVLKNPIESKLAAIDHFTPITLAILKSNRVIAQDPQFQRFKRNPKQIDAAIADLIEALITLSCVEIKAIADHEKLEITDTVNINNITYEKESEGNWYEKQTGNFVTDPRLIAILNKAHGLKTTNFATHTVNYEGVNYTKDPNTGIWSGGPQNNPVEKSQTQLISILDDLLAHKNDKSATNSVNDNSPK
jgi:hypothetical protein